MTKTIMQRDIFGEVGVCFHSEMQVIKNLLWIIKKYNQGACNKKKKNNV